VHTLLSHNLVLQNADLFSIIDHAFDVPYSVLLTNDVSVYYHMGLGTLARGAVSAKWWGFVHHRLDII
jgi:hypothetical protein